MISYRTHRVAGDCEGREYLCILGAGQHMRSKYELSIINDERNAVFWADAFRCSRGFDDMGKRVAHLQPGLSRCSGVSACAGAITCFRSLTAPEFAVPVLFGTSWGIARLGSWAGYGTYVLRARTGLMRFFNSNVRNSWSCLKRGLTGCLGEG